MNFFTKQKTTIYAIFIILTYAICIIYFGIKNAKQKIKSLLNYHKTSKNNTKPNYQSIIKKAIKEDCKVQKKIPFNSERKHEIESKIPKIEIIIEKFNKIQFYIFVEKDDKIVLLNYLSKEEKLEINKIKNNFALDLNYLKKRQNIINEKQKECDNLINQKKLFILYIQKNINKIKYLKNIETQDKNDISFKIHYLYKITTSTEG